MANTHELVQLQDELYAEVNKDAPHIARGVFGDTSQMPDIARVSNQQLDQVYRQKFQSEDRQWLQAEARRDPEQFLKVTERIGVRMPDPGSNQPPPSPAPLPMPAPSPVAPPMPPAVPPPVLPVAPVVAPSLPSAPVQGMTSSPVILGPNGQPLPPSGVL